MRGATGSGADGTAKIEPMPVGAEVAAGWPWGLRLSGPAKAGLNARKVVTKVENAIRCICILLLGTLYWGTNTSTATQSGRACATVNPQPEFVW